MIRESRRRHRPDVESTLAHLRDEQSDLDAEDFAPKVVLGRRLRGADLRGADLRRARLEGCDLRNADLTGARLDGADLSWVDLSNACLVDVEFGSCRLVEAMLTRADVRGADLRRVTGLGWESVRDIEGFRQAKWPDGFDRAVPRVAGPLIHRGPR